MRNSDTFELEGCVELELLVVDAGGAVKAALLVVGARSDLVRDTAVGLVCCEDIAASSCGLLYELHEGKGIGTEGQKGRKGFPGGYCRCRRAVFILWLGTYRVSCVLGSILSILPILVSSPARGCRRFVVDIQKGRANR